MEKELTHEKMHELGIEHAHTHTHSHQQTKAVLNRMSKIIGHMESVRTMVEVCDRRCEPGHFKRPH